MTSDSRWRTLDEPIDAEVVPSESLPSSPEQPDPQQPEPADFGGDKSVVESELVEINEAATVAAVEVEPASQQGPATDAPLSAESVEELSWVFRCWRWSCRAFEWMLGTTTLVVLLAVVSAIPILQVITLGYFLESSARIARTGRFWSGVLGAHQAARIGSLVLGTWLSLLPLQYLSSLWYASNLISAGSATSQVILVLQAIFSTLLIAHVVAAWYCGGRLRHFFWPFIAPFSIGLWMVRKGADSRVIRPILNQTLGLISPRLVQDLCRAKPLTDWFLPAVILKGLYTGELFRKVRSGLWDFLVGLKLPHLFWLGLRGFVGTLAWLFVPTLLMIGATRLADGAAILSGLLSVLTMAVVLIYVPFLQTHFAHHGRMFALFDIAGARRAFRGAPLLHMLSLFVLLLFALPLFLFKIERIPTELLWAPGIVFVAFMWPARMLVAWAYAKGISRPSPRGWYFTWPSRVVQFATTLTFALIVLSTPYVAWNGALSLLEHHEVLVPAPFLRIPL